MISKLHIHLKQMALLATMSSLGAAGLFASTALTPAIASARSQPYVGVSENWAGYVDAGKDFSSVSGTWRVPAVKASSTGQAYSVAWVGLGGATSNSSALEQVGTASDYANGRPQYFAWYELVPAAQQPLKLAIHPGDQISAKVTVNGSDVTVSLADQTTGQSVTETLQTSHADTSSAEWIVEAPALQTPSGNDAILPLADFGKVQFTSATATAGGHTGGISDSDWSTTRVKLSSDGSNGPVIGFAGGGPQFLVQESSPSASASTLFGDGFTVSWQQGTRGRSPTVVELPGGFAPGGFGPGPYYTTVH